MVAKDYTKSFLCVGLDPHLSLVPEIFDLNNSKFEKVEKFCYSLLDCCVGLVPAIKTQIALFEQLGPKGMSLLASLCKNLTYIFTINNYLFLYKFT